MYSTNAVKAVILNNDKILILEKNLTSSELWDLPGGLIENNESEEQALQREVREELDIDICILKSIGNWQFIRNIDSRVVYVSNYLCLIEDSDFKITLSDEHKSYKWIFPTDFQKLRVKDKSLTLNILSYFENRS